MSSLPNPSFTASMRGTEYYLTGSKPINFAIMHQKIEPYSVTLVVPSGEAWQFDRSLLSDGLHEKVGEGNVRVFPVDEDPNLVGIALIGERDDMVFVTKKEMVRYFLDIIENFSPANADYSDDIDRELTDMLN